MVLISRRALIEGALCQTEGCRHWGGALNSPIRESEIRSSSREVREERFLYRCITNRR